MRVALVVAGLVLVVACTDEPIPAAPTPTPTIPASPAPSGPTPTKPPRPKTATVPLVTGKSIVAARAALAAKGFRADVRAVEYSACVWPRVLKQDPPRGWRREVGSKVRLDVSRRAPGECGLDLPPAEPELDRAGRAFVDFARGGEPDEHLLRSPVGFYLGGRLLHTIPGWRALHRLSYGWLCPSYGYYSARTCPFSAVRAIATYPGPMAVTREAPQMPCGGGTFLNGRLARTVTLTPDESRSCVDYFAVELAVSDQGRLIAVNLVMSEP
jgi:hypothetical protein